VSKSPQANKSRCFNVVGCSARSA
ncbi:general secretion pathway protein GspH, partial [Escherichia coli]